MKQKQPSKFNLKRLVQDNSVPLMFVVLCLICLPLAGYSPSYLINELVTRMGRNTFLILSLLIPIMAGMGLNFGMTLGAMADFGVHIRREGNTFFIPGNQRYTARSAAVEGDASQAAFPAVPFWGQG